MTTTSTLRPRSSNHALILNPHIPWPHPLLFSSPSPPSGSWGTAISIASLWSPSIGGSSISRFSSMINKNQIQIHLLLPNTPLHGGVHLSPSTSPLLVFLATLGSGNCKGRVRRHGWHKRWRVCGCERMSMARVGTFESVDSTYGSEWGCIK